MWVKGTLVTNGSGWVTKMGTERQLETYLEDRL